MKIQSFQDGWIESMKIKKMIMTLKILNCLPNNTFASKLTLPNSVFYEINVLFIDLRELVEIKDLLTSHVNTACSGTITRESVIGLLNAIFDPCQGSSDSGNTNDL